MAMMIPPHVADKIKTIENPNKDNFERAPSGPQSISKDAPINIDGIETPELKPVQMPGSGYGVKSKPMPGMEFPTDRMPEGPADGEPSFGGPVRMPGSGYTPISGANPEPLFIIKDVPDGHKLFDDLSLEEKAEVISNLHDQIASGKFESPSDAMAASDRYDLLMQACAGEPKEVKSIPYDTYAAYKQEMESVHIPDSAAAAEFAKHTREKYFGEYGDPESVAKTMEQLDKNGQFEGFDDPSNENISRNVDLTFMGGQVVSSPCTERPQFERDIAEPRIDTEVPPRRNNPQVVPQGGGSSGVPHSGPQTVPQSGGSSGVPHSGPQPAPYGGPEGGSKSEQPAFVTKFLNKAEAEASSVNDVAKSGLSIAE